MSNSVEKARAPEPGTGPGSSAGLPALPVGAGGQAAVSGRWSIAVGRWAWVPVVLLLAAMVALKAVNDPACVDSPALRAVLTLVFGVLVALVVMFLMGRSFLARGQPGMLLLGCGMFFLGASGIVATVAGGRDVNLNVTIFNLCAWLAGGCHLIGAYLLLRRRRPLPAPGLWLGLAAVAVVSGIGLVALAARQGWTPVFFVQGRGGTAVRQLVLSSAVTFFAVAALLPGAGGRRRRSAFFHWYSLALSLMAVGLLGAMLQPGFGSLLSWTAWGAMCLSGVYMFMAAVASLGQPRAWGASLEVALHESEERFQALTQASFEGIALTEEGRLIDGNEQLFQMLGYRREELLGREMSALHTPENRERVRAVVRAGREACMESSMMRKDGTRILIEAHGKPLMYQGRPVRVTAFRDITAHKQTEEALREAQAKLEAHAGELEQTVARRTAKLHEVIVELERFSYAITHDMRAPLRAMHGYAALIDSQCSECRQAQSREFFRRIQVATRRMDQLITDSLSYSKALRQELRLESVNLGELLQGMIDTYPNLLPDKVDIVLEADLPAVMGSPAALTQCFGNLLDNAVKFAKPNTRPQIRVWVEVVRRAAGGPGAGEGAKAEGQAGNGPPAPEPARIWVEDNGIGIPQEMRERIFGLFERGSNEHDGTGLGLAIVRKLVRRMGGEAGVESEPGQGSRFWMELELATAAAVIESAGRRGSRLRESGCRPPCP